MVAGFCQGWLRLAALGTGNLKVTSTHTVLGTGTQSGPDGGSGDA
jgi:hypothetical protein